MNKNKTTVLGDEETREESEEESEKFFSDPNFVHFIGMLAPPRPGVELCFTQLEHTYFPPGSDINKDFIMRLVNWEGTIWSIVSIPKTEIDLMKKVAAKNGLRLAKGTPQMFTQGGKKPFPIKDNERIFTLENVTGHPVYANDPKNINNILAKEMTEMERIFAEAEHQTKKEAKNKNDPG